jgi:hypothetical protein
MFKSIHILLSVLICCTIPAAASAAGKRPADTWNYYHFDGTAFKSGPSSDGTAYLAVREKLQPVVLTSQASPAAQTTLPDGAGVIAGICYLQSSGGKLGGGSRYKPCSHAALLISSGGRQLVTVQTDENGYFVAVLQSGAYSVGSGPITTAITVEPGTTTLVPLRAGKRMVD